jgi:hypothetical protein
MRIFFPENTLFTPLIYTLPLIILIFALKLRNADSINLNIRQGHSAHTQQIKKIRSSEKFVVPPLGGLPHGHDLRSADTGLSPYTEIVLCQL